MKICPNCGAMQDDKRIKCIDCGTRLEEPLPSGAEKLLREKLSGQIDAMASGEADFALKRGDYITLILYGAVAVGGLASWVFSPQRGEIWPLGLCALLVLIFGALGTAFPKISWAISRFRIRMTTDSGDLRPNHWYHINRRIANVILLLLGGALFFLMIVYALQAQPF